MNIYSLQEENDKLNAARGIPRSATNWDMFDMKKSAGSPRQQRRAAASASAQQRQRIPASLQRTQASAQQQKKSVAVPPSHPAVPPAQSGTPQNRGKRRGLAIGWFLFMFFLFLVSFLLDRF